MHKNTTAINLQGVSFPYVSVAEAEWEENSSPSARAFYFSLLCFSL